MVNKQVVYPNSNINYSIYGSGKPIMLVHGFAEDSSIFSLQVSELQQSYRVIVPDLPGIGKSDMLSNDTVQITDYAAVLKAIIDEEKIPLFTLFGHSLGGYITLAFAEKYPETLNGFGLLHSSAFADDAIKIATRKKAISFIENNGTEAFLKTTIPNLFHDAEICKNEIKGLVEKGNTFNPKVLIQQYHSMIDRPDRTSILKQFDRPILFIIGQHDKAVPFEQSLQQSHLPQIAYVNILRNTGHMGMKEEPILFNKFLGEFLQAI